MSEHQAVHRIATMCRMLGVSTSGYYAWQGREPSTRAKSNAELLERIRTIHTKSRQTYGAPRVHAELQDELKQEKRKVSYNRVARLMRKAGIQGVCRRKGYGTTRRDKDARPAPDLVQREFVADAPDRLWVADIT